MDQHYLAQHYAAAHHQNPSIVVLLLPLFVFWLITKAIRDGKRLRGDMNRNETGGTPGSFGLLAWCMSLFTLLKKSDPQIQARESASQARQAEIIAAIRKDTLPESMRARLAACRDGTSPWIATLSPAELLIARSHGVRPVAAVSATCWMQYGQSWTNGHAQGWGIALKRLKDEARAAGANAVVDVKMRTIPLDIGDSMDFSLTGTAVKIDGLPASQDPVVATVPALEFVKLLEADIVPTGIAIGAEYQWMNDWRGRTNLFWAGNTECKALSDLWNRVRRKAHSQLLANLQNQGNGALAHVNFSQMFEREGDPKQYLARHIVIATTVDTPNVSPLARQKPEALSAWQPRDAPQYVDRKRIDVPVSSLSAAWQQPKALAPLPLDFRMVVDMHAGKTPLRRTIRHHQSYALNEEEGAI